MVETEGFLVYASNTEHPIVICCYGTKALGAKELAILQKSGIEWELHCCSEEHEKQAVIGNGSPMLELEKLLSESPIVYTVEDFMLAERQLEHNPSIPAKYKEKGRQELKQYNLRNGGKRNGHVNTRRHQRRV